MLDVHMFARNKYMHMKKLFILAAGVVLLAAGCSKAPQAPNPAAAPAADSVVAKVPAPAAELDPQRDWIRFYPSDVLKFNLLFPLTWWGDEDNGDTHFVLRSRKGAEGSKVDDVIMDFTVGPMTAKTLSAQVISDSKGAKDVSAPMTALTDKGVPYAFATYIDASGKPTLGLAIQYRGTDYIHLKVTGNVAYPYVGRMIQSIAVIGQ